MIKLFSLKQEKEKEAAAASSGEKKIAPGLIRMQKGAHMHWRGPPLAAACAGELSSWRMCAALLACARADVSELKDEKGIQIVFPDKSDIMNFQIKISPFDGYYRDGTFVFDCKVPNTYPHEAPKILCTTQIFHPNIDMEGHVCLNILREDWKPVLDINAVIYGLIYLFYEPNPDDPLNHEAAEQYRSDLRQFEAYVQRSLKGYSVNGESFERLL